MALLLSLLIIVIIIIIGITITTTKQHNIPPCYYDYFCMLFSRFYLLSILLNLLVRYCKMTSFHGTLLQTIHNLLFIIGAQKD